MAMTMIDPLVSILRKGMKDAGYTQQALFEEYRKRGGLAKQPNTLGEWLRGRRDIPTRQLHILVVILNAALEAKGLERLPIVLPFGEGLGGLPDEADKEPPAGIGYFQQRVA